MNHKADLASAKQLLSAAIRNINRATQDSQPDDKLIGIAAQLADAYFALADEMSSDDQR